LVQKASRRACAPHNHWMLCWQDTGRLHWCLGYEALASM
jgi:hypothetical protein